MQCFCFCRRDLIHMYTIYMWNNYSSSTFYPNCYPINTMGVSQMYNFTASNEIIGHLLNPLLHFRPVTGLLYPPFFFNRSQLLSVTCKACATSALLMKSLYHQLQTALEFCSIYIDPTQMLKQMQYYCHGFCSSNFALFICLPDTVVELFPT